MALGQQSKSIKCSCHTFEKYPLREKGWSVNAIKGLNHVINLGINDNKTHIHVRILVAGRLFFVLQEADLCVNVSNLDLITSIS